MTERKPAELSFASWIDQQITEAEARGAFDDLPGAGKPLPRRGEEDAGQAWLRNCLHREGISTEEALPEPLRLRKEAERLTASARDLPSEEHVRQAVAELNERIVRWRRIPIGPPVYVPLLNPDELAGHWRAAHLAAGPGAAPEPGARPAGTPAVSGRSRRWWRHRRTHRRT